MPAVLQRCVRFLSRLVVVLAALIAFTAAAEAQQLVPDVDTFECDTIEGFSLTNFTATPPDDASVGAIGGAVVLQYQREHLAAVLHAALMTELRELRVTVRSQVELTLAIGLADPAAGSAFATIHVPANSPVEFAVGPDDFVAATRAVDPRTLGVGYVLFDTGALGGATGPNTLSIEQVVVEREDLVRLAGLELSGSRMLDQSTVVDGGLVLHAGAVLRVSSPRFVVLGDIACEAAELEIESVTLRIPQRFNHERGLAASGATKITITGSFVLTDFPLAVQLVDTAKITVNDGKFFGGLTLDAQPGSTTRLVRCANAGEFIVAPGANVRFIGSAGFLVWLNAGTGVAGNFTFPEGAEVPEWSPGNGFDVIVTNCSSVMFGVLSMPGSNVTVENSYAPRVWCSLPAARR
jgi:hypothetical protein